MQPRKGIYLQLNVKQPGTKNIIVPIRMDFCQNCDMEINSPEAYERLLLDVIQGDYTLFTSWDEVESSWKYLDPVLKEWADTKPLFPNYSAGQQPLEADRLLARSGRRWWEL